MSDIELRKQRWRDFYDRKPGQAYRILVNYDPDAPARPLPWPNNTRDRIEWAWGTYQRQLKRAAWLADDSMPCLDCYTGTEIFAAAFGCAVYRPDDNMPFAQPLICHASQVAGLKVPDLDVAPLRQLFEIGDELRRRDPAALVRLVDVQSPMDIAALIWDKNDFYTAMIESPEAVKELAGKVKQLLVTFLDAWFARYGRDFVAHYPWYYMPSGVTMSVDEVGAVSEEMFREFFLPELIDLSHHFGQIGIHCCANSMHQWENFASVPNLVMLNLVRPPEQQTKAMEFFAGRVALLPHGPGEGAVWTLPEKYPAGTRAVVEVTAASREVAVEMVARFREAAALR